MGVGRGGRRRENVGVKPPFLGPLAGSQLATAALRSPTPEELRKDPSAAVALYIQIKLVGRKTSTDS
jgi:hypothetical protein